MKRFEKAVAAYRAAAGGGESADPGHEQSPGARPKGKGAGSGRSDVRSLQNVLNAPKQEAGAARAAKLLLLLDKDQAAAILSRLRPEEVERVSREIARTQRVDATEARKILHDFGRGRSAPPAAEGGTETARDMLSRAFGEERADALLKKVMPFGRENPFDFLEDLDFQQILLVMKREPASVISVVLPHIDAAKASLVLESLPREAQIEVARRIARMRKVSPEALIKVSEALRERIRRQGRIVTEEIDGRATLAGILRHLSWEAEETILTNLEHVNPEISEEIREQLVTIDVVFRIDDQHLQAVLRDFSDEEIAVVLKAKSADVRARILSQVSERRRLVVQEEMERLGRMKKTDVAKTTRDFVLYIRELADDGRLVIHREDEYLDGERLI